MTQQHGGDIVGALLARRGVRHLFTLCGGHISPILTGAKAQGIEIIDVRDEVSAVFAADAVARMTGIPGVAAVTAGPGVTNTVTAVKNAQMAESPLVVLGGATATVLKGRGSLQDIDQLSLMRPITKWATTVKTVPSLEATLERAFDVASEGTPGPVFVEIPVDLLYPEAIVRDWYIKENGLEDAQKLGARALKLYLQAHLFRQFRTRQLSTRLPRPPALEVKRAVWGASPGVEAALDQTAALLRGAKKPVLVVGSQALANATPAEAEALADALTRLGLPTFLAGTARGLLGRFNDLQLRHRRSQALKAADVVLVAGFPFDFRLGYGRSINAKASLVAINLNASDLRKNRRPDLPVQTHPGAFLRALAERLADAPPGPWDDWFATLRDNEQARDDQIAAQAEDRADDGLVNPLRFFEVLEEKMGEGDVLVVDGGDFVATAAYILRPRAPLRWLDPGVFGTLGVGGGFALGAALCHPDAQVWLIYGDGSSGYSLAELDTCVRHGLTPIAVIGNDGSWAQIARDQIEILDDDVGTVLERRDYHTVAQGYGAEGLLLTDPDAVEATIARAQALAAQGRPVVINVHISRSDFRKGSLSM